MQPSLSLPSLYCNESIDNLEEDGDGGAATAAAAQTTAGDDSASVWVDFHRPIANLLAAEVDHMPAAGYSKRFSDGGPLDPAARLTAVDWILKVNDFHGFHPSTAFVSVNYLDRFISLQPHLESYDTWRLLAVACLSVAAKMGETAPPPLQRLQNADPQTAFDFQTVNKMERHVLRALQWRMRPVTPFDFVDSFVDLLSAAGPFGGATGAVADVILATRRVIQMIGQRPSEIAAAVILLALGTAATGEHLSLIYEVVNEEDVENCRRLMEEHLTDTCRLFRRPGRNNRQEPAGSVPGRKTPPTQPEEQLLLPPSKRRKTDHSLSRTDE